MKELKFRAWHKYQPRYLPVDVLDFVEEVIYVYELGDEGYHNDYLYNFSSIIIEQFTGLKDKNGKEIYEGDIVIYDFARYTAKGPEPIAGIVKYSTESAAYGIVPLAYPDSIEWFGELAINAPLEVIGNIHENPELLGK